MIRQKIAATFLILTAMPFLVICQTKPVESKAAREVRQTDEKFHKAIRTSDVATLENLLATDFIWTHSTGNIQTKAVVLDNLKTGRLKYESLETDDVKIYLYERAAVASGHSNRKYPDKEGFELRYTVFYVKEHGKWRAAAFHTSILPKK